MWSSKNLLLKITGSIAAYKSCELISQLKKRVPHIDIRVVASKNALRFVGKESLEGLTGNPVSTELFQDGKMMEHISLARWADAIIVYPATANTIQKLAQGHSDNLIGSLFLAYELEKKPYLIAPAMNSKMLSHPATQQSLKTLESWGVQILPTESGPLACGETGLGRLLQPEKVLPHLLGTHKSLSAESPKKILVTSGATREPLDGVRFLTNFSSGKTGAQLAQAFSQNGHQVHYLHGVSAAMPNGSMARTPFLDFKDLSQKLKTLLNSSHFDAVVQCAAIGDYHVSEIINSEGSSSPENWGNKKIPSGEQLDIKLKKNPKLLSELHTFSKNKDLQIVGFKLTKSPSTNEHHQAIKKIVTHSRAGFVVHNDLLQIERGEHTFTVYDRQLNKTGPYNDPQSLAKKLLSLLFSSKESPKEVFL